MDLDTIDFRPLVRADLAMLHEWLRRPHVAEWWGAPSGPEDLEAEFFPARPSGGLEAFVVTLDGRPVGFIQHYTPAACHADGWWLDEHDPGVRGIDQFIAEPDLLGRGLGTAMIRRFVARLFDDPAVTRVQTDPDPGNPRAIRCYGKSGFRGVGVVTTPDGPALLMYVDRAPRFLADAMLGRLARWLRVAGCDALQLPTATPDHELVARANAEGRVLLTRDRHLVRELRPRLVQEIVHDVPLEQLREVVERWRLRRPEELMTRCLLCNTELLAVAPAEAATLVPVGARDLPGPVRRCAGCGRVYWRGSHVRRMEGALGAALPEWLDRRG